MQRKGTNDNFLPGKQYKSDGSGTTFLEHWKEDTVNLKFYTQFQKKEVKTSFDTQKVKEFIAGRPSP